MADDLKSQATELAKKILTVGVGTLFLTEESLRGLISEFKLPKEMITGILESASKTKNEFLRSMASEVMSKVSNHMDPKALVEEILAKNDLEFNIKLSFKPKDKN